MENTPEVVKRASFLSENKISLSRLPENLRTSFYTNIRDTAHSHSSFVTRPSKRKHRLIPSARMDYCLRGERLRDGDAARPGFPGQVQVRPYGRVKDILVHQLCGQCPNLKIFPKFSLKINEKCRLHENNFFFFFSINILNYFLKLQHTFSNFV